MLIFVKGSIHTNFVDDTKIFNGFNDSLFIDNNSILLITSGN